MNLPGYFLADLPPEATLNAAMVADACRTLKRNRAQYLARRTTQDLINTLCEVARRWQQSDDRFRALALDLGVTDTGFSRQVLSSGLDEFFSQFTTENLQELIVQELGHVNRMDEFVANLGGQPTGRMALARGPELLVHIAAGNLPNPTLTSMVFGLLTRSAQFVKCATGAALLPRLFAHSIYDAEPKLGACLEIVDWPGGHKDLETALHAEADCLTITGDDKTLAAVRGRLPVHVRFLGYGHRVSFGFIGHDSLSHFAVKTVAADAAADVAAWDQLGCLSPHLFYIEAGGAVSPELFAEMLADELSLREATHPRGNLATEAAAAIASRRALYEVRAAASSNTLQWSSKNSTAWTVIYESDPQFQLSCLSRFVYVKPVINLTEVLNAAGTVRGKVSTVGIAASDGRKRELAVELAHWGVPRICPVGKMQHPPLTWRHDGRPGLGDLVTWTDWEQ